MLPSNILSAISDFFLFFSSFVHYFFLAAINIGPDIVPCGFLSAAALLLLFAANILPGAGYGRCCQSGPDAVLFNNNFKKKKKQKTK